jgi:hypothetical protein
MNKPISFMSKIKVVGAVSALMAVALAWVLVTQDRTDIWNVGATIDLPEMAQVHVDDITVVAAPLPDPKPSAPPPFGALIYLLSALVVPARWVMHDASPTAQGYSPPLFWLLANPKTAPPR